jgi:hypothetical protein
MQDNLKDKLRNKPRMINYPDDQSPDKKDKDRIQHQNTDEGLKSKRFRRAMQVVPDNG